MPLVLTPAVLSRHHLPRAPRALTPAQARVAVHVAAVGEAEARRAVRRLEASVAEHPGRHAARPAPAHAHAPAHCACAHAACRAPSAPSSVQGPGPMSGVASTPGPGPSGCGVHARPRPQGRHRSEGPAGPGGRAHPELGQCGPGAAWLRGVDSDRAGASRYCDHVPGSRLCPDGPDTIQTGL